jgi:hypothetical protein
MRFRQTDLHDLEVAREVRIETQAASGVVHSTIVWVVVDDGEVFVRSVRGERGRWFQEALVDDLVTINDVGRRLEARAVQLTDAATIARIDAALARKYTGDPGYDSMIKPEAQQANLRLEPRTEGEIPLEAPAYLGDDEPSEIHGHPIEVGLLDGGAPVDQDVLLQPHKPA